MAEPIIDRDTLLKVLDHGYIRLIDYMGRDESIVEAARMSTGKGFISWDPYQRCDVCGEVQLGLEPNINVTSRTCEKHQMTKYANGDLGMLDTLWRKKHATPFEMVEVVFEVKAPLFVFREWHRHRTQSYNEFSARYSQMPDEHYLPTLEEVTLQSSLNKQAGSASAPEEIARRILEDFEQEQADIYENYDHLVGEGIAKEIARINTPVSRYSTMRAKGNLRNWFAFLNLRERPTAQKQIRVYAEAADTMLSWLFPKAHALFHEYDLYGASFSRTELRILRKMIHDIDGALPENSELTGTKLKEFVTKLKEGGDKILG